MTSTVEKLLALQEIDSRIREVERELKEIPARKKGEEDRLGIHRKEVAEAERKLKATQTEIKKLELENASRNEKIGKFRQQQLELKTNREFKAIDTEIEGVQREIGALEEQELVLMEHVEKSRAEVAASQKALVEEQALVSVDVAKLDERIAHLNREAQELRAGREAAARGVEELWLTRYDSVFKRKDRALVPLQDGICGGCHMKLPPSVAHDRRRGDVMVTCNFCGRLVY